ncbi:MAG TPA: hypothetical protein VFJ10_05070 [Acidobacteriaceae bacterium]|nr:hypothetical protein [Acidobacteriaceae bacterium]
MLAECAFLYPDGRNCRRIPRRGDTLCPDHRRQAAIRVRTTTEEQAFHLEQNKAADEIIRQPLDQMLDHAQECLMALEPWIEVNAPAVERTRFMRIGTAIAAAMDCVDSQPGIVNELFTGFAPDERTTLVQLLWFARPDYAAKRRAIENATHCVRKHLKTK